MLCRIAGGTQGIGVESMAKRPNARPQSDELDVIRQEAMEFAGIGLYRYSFDGTIMLMDKGALRIFELEDRFANPGDVIGRNISEILVYTEPKGVMRKEIRRAGCVRGRDWSFRTLNGHDKWVVENSYLVRDPETGEEAIQVITQDITERKRAEEALRASERRFRDTFDHAALVAAQIDIEGCITYCNEYLLSLTGWRRDELLGRDWIDTFILPESRSAMRALFLGGRVDPNKIPRLYENPIVTRNGELRLIFWSNTVLRDKDNCPVGLTCIGQDITLRKRAEAVLARSARISDLLRNVIAAMNACRAPNEIFDPLLNTAMDLCEMDTGAIYTIDNDKAVLRCHRKCPADLLDKIAVVPLYSPGVQAAMSAEEPVFAGDLAEPWGVCSAGLGYRHTYTAPLHAAKEAFGLLQLGSRRETPLDSEGLQALRTLIVEAESLFTRLRAEDELRGSQTLYRDTLDNMADAIHLVDRDLRIVFMNDAFLKFNGELGLATDTIGKDLFSVYPFLGKKVRDEYEQVLATGIPLVTEERTILAGREIITETRKFPAFEHGRVSRILTVLRDITERKRSEEALQESEDKYRSLVEMFPHALIISQDGKVVFANETVRDLFRYQRGENLLGKEVLSVVVDRERDRINRYTQERLRSPNTVPEHYETVLQRNDGEEFPAEIFIKNIHFQGRPAAQVLVSDITDRYRAQKALQESEERYRSILENIEEGYYEVNLKGDFVFLNPALSRIFGYTEQEMRGLNYRNFYPDDKVVARVEQTFRHVFETGVAMQLFDWPVIRKDGAEAIFEVSVSLMYDNQGERRGFRGLVRDVTERIQAERALREAEARYRELFENANDIVYTHDLEGRFTSLNKAGERISGYSREEALGINALEIIAPEYREFTRDMVRRKLAGEEPTQYESAIIAKDGRVIPVEVSTRLILEDGNPVAVQGIARDITERKQAEQERKRLEAQIQHTQKLEGLGVLAGGIAHDFNNLLVGILGNAGLALKKLPQDAPAAEYVRRIEATAQRAAELTSQMLAYSGRGSFVVRPLNLSAVAEEMGYLLQASISKKAILRYQCAPSLPLIEGDAAQIHQVLINLITNASDALGDREGVIVVATGSMPVDRAYLSRTYLADDLLEGLYVYLEVSDTGCGMDAETQARIFDPFFSTKFAGRGLGLASVLGIVRKHRGALTVYSEPGHGTTIRVLFPAFTGEQPANTRDEQNDDIEKISRWRGRGVVLVADDEAAVRTVSQETFAEWGFNVLVANDGREAVEIFRNHADEIRLVLLDLTMPVMGGEEALRRIRQTRPGVPVILSSGYTEQDATTRFEKGGPSAFVQKPYLPSDLMRVVRNVLGESAPGRP